MNIAEILQQQAHRFPKQPAIIDSNDQVITFGELNQVANRTARFLQAAGVKPGDGILVFQPMSILLYQVLIGIFRLGAIALFLDPGAGQDHIDRCCQLYPPKALIASPKAYLLCLTSAELRKIPLKFSLNVPIPGTIYLNSKPRETSASFLYPCSGETPALLTFTSGSTGRPKAAVRTHEFLIAQHQVLARNLHLQSGEVDLTTLPIFLLANLASGVTSLIPNANLKKPGEIQVKPILKQLQIYKPTRTAASPAFLEKIAQYCQDNQLKLTYFQQIYTGGAPVFPRLIQQLKAVAPQAKVISVYGSTEAEPIAHCVDSPIIGNGLLVGQPISEIELRILKYQGESPIYNLTDSEFKSKCLPSKNIGEIVVSGNHVLKGYFQGIGDLETKFKVKETIWHRTGDSGYLDEEGNLWLMGRCKACIQDQKGILYPFALECTAQQFDFIKRSAVVAHQQQRWLMIEPNPQFKIELEALQTAVSPWKIDQIKILKKIPVDRRHNAKIDYPALDKLLKSG